MAKKEPEKTETHRSSAIAPPKSIIREYFESFVVTLVMAIFGMTFIIQAVTVPTGSMQNTILIGDYLLVNKFIFAPGGRPLPFLPQREIQRGDIIVFKYPGNKKNPQRDRDLGVRAYQVNYVKRVIGMPGDEVEFKNNQVFINGNLLPEIRVIGEPMNGHKDAELDISEFEPNPTDAKYTVYYAKRTMERVKRGGNVDRDDYEYGVQGRITKVPDDSYFVMGDSRDNSEDSRFWGFVNRDLIIGRAMFVYWSCDRADGGGMLSCITNPRLSRIGKLIK